jgi:glycosyltransferase involved in cell wall biosynthesis
MGAFFSMSQLTVIMPVYNALPYLPMAVNSILGQSLQDFELVMVDDGSSDGSGNFLDSIHDARVRIHHQRNRGPGAAFNAGLAQCASEFVARMDADDLSAPERLEKQIQFLKKNEDIGVVGTHIDYLGNSGRHGYPPPLPTTHAVIVNALLRGEHGLCQATMMCHTQLLRAMGGYQIDDLGEDWDLILRLGEKTRLANLKDILYHYRLHPSNSTIQNLEHVRQKIRFACKNTARRNKHIPEMTFSQFREDEEHQAAWQKLNQKMVLWALTQYHAALVALLNNHLISGYCRLIGSALASPSWTMRRLKRIWQRPPSA